MLWELRATILAGLLAMGAAPAPPSATVDLATGQPSSVMTGTIAERNEKIKTMLEKGTGRIEQMSFHGAGLATVSQLVGMQTRVDIRPDWPALEKVGITPTTTTSLNLYGVTVQQVLRATLMQLRPAKGQLVWKVENGVLAIVPVEDETPPRETESEQQLDGKGEELLKGTLDAGQLLGNELTLDQALRFLSMQKKLNVLVDWRELKAVNVLPDTKVVVDATDATGEGLLKAVLAKVKPVGGTMGYEFRWGMLRISTAERLAKEKKMAAEAEEAGKLP
jgi:hypothetical protein